MDLILSPDYVPTSMSDLGTPDLPEPRRKCPTVPSDANRVFAVFSKAGSLLGVLTSPVDAAEAAKSVGPGSFVQTCVLNAL